jgi:hypothetical protein
MHLTVLAVAGCPNAALLEERLAGVLEGRPGVTVSRHVIADEAAAARRGIHELLRHPGCRRCLG